MDISDAVVIAVITGLPPTIAAVASLVVSIRNGKKVDEIHKTTNSMSDKLLAVTRSDALQEGHTAGVADEKQRTG